MACCFFCRGCRRKKQSSSNQHPTSASPAHATTNAALVCHTCRRPIAPSDRHVHIQQHFSPRRYHIDCFVCLHCHAPIKPQREEFCYSKLNKKKGAKTRERRSTMQSMADDNGTNDIEADNNNNNYNTDTPPTNRRHANHQLVNDDSLDIQTEEDDDEHPFHRACFAHRFGWLCVVCEQPLPMATKLIEDLSSNYGGDTTSINEAATSNQNSFDNDRIMVGNSSAPDHDTLILSNRNIKWRRTTKVEFLKHPFFSNERMCPHHVETTASSGDTMMMRQQQRQQQVGIDYFYDSRGGGDGEQGEDSFTIPEVSSTTDAGRGQVGERTIRRCAGCHRFEPALASPAKHFVNVGDPNSEQCLCLACCRTVVTSSEDVVPLWDRVSSIVRLISLCCSRMIMFLIHSHETCRLLTFSRDHWV